MATKAKKIVKKKNSMLLLAVSFIVFLMLSVIGGYFALIFAGQQLIDTKKIDALKTEATVVYDKNKKEIGSLYVNEAREYKPITQIPKHVVDAFVAVEDKRFFEHNGVDMIRIGGAIAKDLRAGAAVEGGSTITQQLAKNVFLSNERTFWRKTKEVSIAIGLERKYSKDQIMEMYLNKIYLGHGVLGVEAASQLYFGKSIVPDNKNKLTLAQAAMLAAIPKAPSHYSPFVDPEKAKERRDTVLRLMYEQNYITKEEKEQAQKESIVPPGRTLPKTDKGMKEGYEAFVDYVVNEAEETYDITEDELYRGGWKIYTTLDSNMQNAMVNAYADPKNFPKNGAKRQVESGMIVVDSKTGGIAGMMGGRNYVHKGFNYAVDSKRQPGSTFKPMAAYAPALDTDDKRWNIYSRLSNKRQSYNGYNPRNYNGKYSEDISFSDALINSMNVPSVWLLNEIGLKTGLDYIKKFGVPLEPEDRNLAVGLGGLHKGTSPLYMAQAYTAFANGGVVSKAHAIAELEHDKIGVDKRAVLQQENVIKPKTAWNIHTILSRAVNEGTGRTAKISGREVAGKTGTTQSIVGDSSVNKDAWFVGYTPEYVGAVWMGFEPEDKQHLMRNGSSLPAKVFASVLGKGLQGVKSAGFVRPKGVEEEEEKTVKVEPLQLAADLTLDNDQMKVVLSWIGNEQGSSTYDVYRLSDQLETKELVASGLTEMVYIDTITEPKLYQYIIVPRDESGTEGKPSNIAEISMTQLENLLKEGELHNDEIQQDGDIPIDGDNPGTDNPSPDTLVDGGNGETGDSQTPPPDIVIPPTEGDQPPTDKDNDND